MILYRAQQHLKCNSRLRVLDKHSLISPWSGLRCFSDGPVTKRLEHLVESGDTHTDPHQLGAAKELDRVYQELMKSEPPPLSTPNSSDSGSSRSMFGSFFGSSASSSPPVSRTSSSSSSNAKGAYMYGGVGCGKTFLMDILYDAVDSGPWAKDKQKVHYHSFMLNVHKHMHQERQKNPTGDLIEPVANQILQSGRFLCLDEFQVTDVADALILQRLFQGLWNSGCVLVATSNRKPRDLYLNGLQRDRFIPFIDLMEQKCAQIDLLASGTDYRMLVAATEELGEVYFSTTEKKQFQKLFHKLTEGYSCKPTALETQGRRVSIPLACQSQKVAEFSFDDLCRKAMGAADYLVIAENYQTVFCHSIPKLTIHHVNWLRRFITFVDTLYEFKVKLILHTKGTSIDDIFVVENKQDYSQDEVFAFDRTRSRLEEMSSKKYLSSTWLGDKQQKDDKARSKTSLNVNPSLADEMVATY